MKKTMTTQEKAAAVLEKAQALAPRVRSWVQFSNELFDPDKGLVAKTFPRTKERQAFYDTPEYDELNQILLALIKRFGGLSAGAATKSGKFIVRIPKTLHTVLEVEAEQEGVSLNQLALTKLSVGLGDSTELCLKLTEQAFREVYDGYSTDWVIVHPDYNARFLKACRERGLEGSDYDLNHRLMDMRKSGKGNLPPATRKAMIRDYDDFAFAGEIAFRYLQRKDGVTLDRVLCDPELRQKFDEVALRLAPNQSVLKLRNAALYLRKTHRLSPKVAGAMSYDLVSAGPVPRLEIGRLPSLPGMYAFYHDVRPIFAGETERLQHRIQLHVDSSNRLGLPAWLDLECEKGLELKFFAAPSLSKDDRLKWLNRFINRELPLLNYQQPSGRAKGRKAG